ncbi:MAG: hypothetical protein ACREP0_10260 [Rhodanobacteraceae bacterium]
MKRNTVEHRGVVNGIPACHGGGSESGQASTCAMKGTLKVRAARYRPALLRTTRAFIEARVSRADVVLEWLERF